jgi:hypothetical protein
METIEDFRERISFHQYKGQEKIEKIRGVETWN